jgi:hypothetical protein
MRWPDRAAYTLAPFDDRNRAVGTEQADELPADPTQADRVIEERVRERVRQSGRCNVSRAVSDLCRGGLLRRHYQGYRVDHQNRGAQREAVYTIMPDTLAALRRR